jgi:hypothetical protein
MFINYLIVSLLSENNEFTMTDDITQLEEQLAKQAAEKSRRNRKIVFNLVIAAFCCSFFYRLLVISRTEQTALMFIGLPTVIALVMCRMPASKTITGSIMKGITFFLLILAILLIEGFICILMAAPFFYSIGFIIGIFADKARAKNHMPHMYCSVIVVLGLMSLEGINETLSFSRDEVIVVETLVLMSHQQATSALARGPSFRNEQLPLYLKMGFPRPQSISGNGLTVGDQWKILFAGGEGKPGELVAQVTEASADFYRVEKISDASHISHWLEWQSAEWHLSRIDEQHTRVVLTMRYRRLLDPAWYFGPAERYGVRLAGKFFLTQTFHSGEK